MNHDDLLDRDIDLPLPPRFTMLNGAMADHDTYTSFMERTDLEHVIALCDTAMLQADTAAERNLVAAIVALVEYLEASR